MNKKSKIDYSVIFILIVAGLIFGVLSIVQESPILFIPFLVLEIAAGLFAGYRTRGGATKL